MSSSAVLVTVTGDQCDAETVRLGYKLLDSHKGRLIILYVIEIDRAFPVDAEIPFATSEGEEILKRMEKVAENFKCETEGELVQARRAGSAIVQEAFDKKVDAIVINTIGVESRGSVLTDDTVPYVINNAPCRVIVWQDPVPNLSQEGLKT